MKKWIISSVILVIILFANKANGQTYTQTFIDKCTGETKVATTTYINGNAVVSFYNQIKTFTPLEVQTGQLQVWLQTTYAAYNTLACPVSIVVQQTITNAVAQTSSQAAATAAASAASSAASTASSTASGAASGVASTAASTPPPPASSSSSSTSSGSSSSSQSSSSSGSGSSSSSSTESKTESTSSSSSESKTESKSESKSESKEEKKSEAKEEKKEEKKEESKEESKEEKKEEKKKEEKKEEKKKQIRMNPIMVNSDLTLGQQATGGFVPVISLGMSQGSATGESSWGLSSMVYADLKSFALSANKSDMIFDKGALKAINAYSYTVAYIAGTNMTFGGYTHIVPTAKRGVFGYNLSYINIKLKDDKGNYSYTFSTSTTGFWTKPFPVNRKTTISPGVFLMASPYAYNSESGNSWNYNLAGLVGTGLTYQISKRFVFAIDWKVNASTTPDAPILNFFMVGTRAMF